MLAVNATVAGTSYAYSLGAATKYYWRVAAVNGGFMSDYTAANNFTTAGSAAAEIPTVLAPANNAIDQPALLTLAVGRTLRCIAVSLAGIDAADVHHVLHERFNG